MLPSTIKPPMFEELVVSESESLCAAQIKAFIRFPYLLYLLVKYFFDNDGNISTAFKADICQALADCPAPTTTTTTTTVTTT